MWPHRVWADLEKRTQMTQQCLTRSRLQGLVTLVIIFSLGPVPGHVERGLNTQMMEPGGLGSNPIFVPCQLCDLWHVT